MEHLEVRCECGVRYKVKTSQEFKKFQCNACKRSVTINVPVAAEWRDMREPRTPPAPPSKTSQSKRKFQPPEPYKLQPAPSPVRPAGRQTSNGDSATQDAPQQVDIHYDLGRSTTFPEIVKREWEAQIDRYIRRAEGIKKVSLRFYLLKSRDFAHVGFVRARIAGTIDGARIDQTRHGSRAPWYVGQFVGVLPLMILHMLNGPNSDRVRAAARDCISQLIVDLLQKSRVRKTEWQKRMMSIWNLRLWASCIAPIPFVILVMARRGLANEMGFGGALFLAAIVGLMAGATVFTAISSFGTATFSSQFLEKDAYGRAEIYHLNSESASGYKSKMAFGLISSLLLLILFCWVIFMTPFPKLT